MKTITFGVLAALCLGSLAVTAPAQTAKPPATAPKKHTVKVGPFRAVAQLGAIVEARNTRPLSIRPKAWTDLSVVKAAAHGDKVSAGDVVLQLDTEKLEKQIEDLTVAEPAAALSLKQAEDALAALEKSTPVALKAAERSARIAEDNLAYYEKVGKKRRIEGVHRSIKNAEHSLEYVSEELKQLEKMYAADDLTEETEEIILKRARISVESSQYRLETLRESSVRTLNTLIPREHKTLSDGRDESGRALESARASLPKALEAKRREVEAAHRARAKAQENLRNLRRDLALLTVKAPVDGIVYYGQSQNGKWTTAAAVAKKLIPGGKVAANEIFMTIVDPGDIHLRAAAAEKQLATLKPGLKGTAAPVSDPLASIPVFLRKLDTTPQPGGTFGAYISISGEANLAPGMNCKVTFVDGEKPDAITIPIAMLMTDTEGRYVVVEKDDKREIRRVVAGATDGKVVVIKEGLAAEEVVIQQ